MASFMRDRSPSTTQVFGGVFGYIGGESRQSRSTTLANFKSKRQGHLTCEVFRNPLAEY